MTVTQAPPRRRLALAGLVTLVALAILLSLAGWQWERRSWKEALIATLDARLSAAPVPLPPPQAWPDLDRDTNEFRRVTLTAEFLHEREALIYSAGSSLRPDVSGVGYWVMTPATVTGGATLLVNRGFVPQERRAPTSRAEGQVTGALPLIGVLRWPEPRNFFTPADDPGRNLWFSRDPQAIAAAKGVSTAPFYLDLESPVPPGGFPKPGPLRVNLPNNHLQYAITWFGLALGLCAVFLVWAFGRSRERLGPAKL